MSPLLSPEANRKIHHKEPWSFKVLNTLQSDKCQVMTRILGYCKIIYKWHVKWPVSKVLFYLLHGEVTDVKTSIYWFTYSLSKSIKVKLKPVEPTLTQILHFNTGSDHLQLLYFIKFLQSLVVKSEFQEKEMSSLWGVSRTNTICHLLASATRFKYCLIGAVQMFTVVSVTSAVAPFQIIFTVITSLYFCS